MSLPLLQQCLALALVAAKRAGEVILEVYHGDIEVEYKEDSTPLTLADERAHRAILRNLSAAAMKHIPILSEEGKHTPYQERKSWEYFWLVDPLDGTKEFIKRRNEFSVNIALIEKNRPVVGVVSVPAVGFLYFAAEGLGSFKLKNIEIIEQLCNDGGKVSQDNEPLVALINSAARLPIQQYADKTIDKVMLVGSRSHGAEALGNFVQRMKQQYGEVELVPAGSALKFCRVAEGSADLYPRFGATMEWDTAAGHCLVEQSGGKVVRMREKTPLDYNKRDLHNPYFVCIGRHFRDMSLPLEPR